MRPQSRLIRSTQFFATAAAIATLVAACGSATPVFGGAGSSGANIAAGDTGGSGTINWEWKLPTSWDPVTSTAGWDVHALSLAYASITRLNPNGSAGPGLAKSWSYSDGGRAITFRLRPGAQFADGSPLTAAVVKANILRGQTEADSSIASELAVIKRVVVVNPTTFRLELTQVDYQVPELLGGKTGMIVSGNALKDPKALATDPDGAGPFALTSYVPDSHADLVRNPRYWDAKDIHLAKFTLQDITEPQQILAALESGQVNVAYIPGNLAAPAKSAGFTILDIPSEVVTELDTQTTSKPFDNPKVIEAINLAIDRPALLKVQQAGYGQVAYQPFPRGYVGYAQALAKAYPYDPAKARALLKQAGPAVRRATLTLTNGLGPTEDPLAEQLQAQLAAVGLRLKIKDVPVDTLTQYLYVDKSVPWAIDQTAGRESPLEMLDVLYDQKGLMNVDGKTAKESPTVQSALAKAEQVPLTSRQYPQALQSAVTTSVSDAGIHVWLYTTPRILAVAKNVHHIPYDFVQQRWEGVTVGG